MFALPASASSESDDTRTLTIDQTIKLDGLGPMVVNSDGTLSRIENWMSMTQEEKERISRVLGARNKLRLANLQNSSSGSTGSSEAMPSDSTV